MKKILTIACLIASVMVAQAQEQIKWLRASSISPDGKTIAFEYQGNLYTVDANGGEARQITSHPAYDGYPKFSPDGKWIAFTSERCGSMDVFIISPNGGKPKRLTTNSATETLQGWLDNAHVLYTSNLLPSISDISFPGNFQQVYCVDTDAHRPVMFSTLPMEDISVNSKGQLLYHNNKGYEDYWRKHHVSPICRDIYLTQVEGKRTYTKLNPDSCEHRTPIWAPDGSSYYYTSERGGTLNIYKTNIATNATAQLTNYRNYPVRYLTAANDGTLCYSWDGELYTLHEGQEPCKVAITLTTDDNERINQPRTLTQGASQLTTNKSEKEFAFIVKGEVYVTNMDYTTTKRITNTIEEEASPSLSPDGRTLVYASERNNTWGIYATTLANPKDKGFTYATDLKEEPLITGNEPFTSPVFSPDGNKIAYLANKTEIRIYDLKTKKSTVVMPAAGMFAYTDASHSFEWSPDSRWILTEYLGPDNWNNPDVAIVSADGKELHNITRSGYADGNPHWALNGKAVTFTSDRAGYRSHGSWGAERDGYVVFLDREAFALANMSKEDRKLYEDRKKELAADTTKTKKTSSAKTKSAKASANKADTTDTLKLDFEDCDKRIKRLTVNSSAFRDGHLTPDGKKYFYQTSFEGGVDLWLHDLEENSTSIFKKGCGGQIMPDSTGNSLFVCDGSMSKLDLTSGQSKNIEFCAEYSDNDAAKMDYVYRHITTQFTQRFADTNYHGADFKTLAEHYATFVPHISNWRDFSELGSELAGELNCSHTGVKYRATVSAPATAVLGAFYDPDYSGDGLKIAEVIKGAPLDVIDRKVEAGHIIKQIDHQPIVAGQDYFPLLAGKVGKRVLLTLSDNHGNDYEIMVKPISNANQAGLLYSRWVDRRAEIVEKETNGQVGYIHIKDMDSESFRKTYADLLGKYRSCKAVIIDERHNGGGWLHNDLAILLSGRKYMSFESRGQQLGIDPFTQWTKPSCLLINEDCYSNANGFPFVYKTLGIGKLIGAPMAGTMTAVWWETLAGGNIVLGNPEVYCRDNNGATLENHNLYPDVEVHNTPEDLAGGYDRQLMQAIEVMK